MKKLLSIIGHLSTGGAPQVLVKRIEIIKEEFDIYVVEFSNLSDIFVIQKNRIKKLLRPGHFFTLGERKEELLDIIDRIDPDFIHFEEIPELFDISFDITEKIYSPNRKYKIFETTHSSDFNVDDKIFFPDKFLFVSQYNCFKFGKFGIPTEVIEYPVEKQYRIEDKKIEAMKKLGLDPRFKHIVNVGLFTPRKNQAYAFEIARKLKDLPFKFHFIGNQADNFADYWKPLLKNKPKNCVLWGERDDVDVFLDACDLFLFTSMGFRWNKELNPLVIKEALEHQIPQFLFPLDVYNRKYDTEDTINYLNGDVDIDAGLIKNFLFERRILPWKGTSPIIKNHKIRIVHLVNDVNKRTEDVIQLEKLEKYGINYVKVAKEKYIGVPPREFCARSSEVGRIDANGLRAEHYGCYLDYKKTIFTEFTDDIDYLMIFESGCLLNVSIEEFVDKVFKSCDVMSNNLIYYMSFGDENNTNRTRELNEWLFTTDRIIGMRSVMFSKLSKKFMFNAFETTLWDTPDFFFNDMFKHKGKAIASNLTKTNKKTITKNLEDFIRDRDPKDIIIHYNKEDQKFYLCLNNYFQTHIENLKIVVDGDDTKSLYSLETSLSPFSSNWIIIYGHQKYKEFTFNIYYKDEFFFSKKININLTQKEIIELERIKEIMIDEENDMEIKEKSDIKDIVYEEQDFEYERYFKVEYDKEENKIFFSLISGEDVFYDIVIRNVDDYNLIYRENSMKFSTHYNVWIRTDENHYKSYSDFNGYLIEFLKGGEVNFEKKIILRNEKLKNVEKIESNKLELIEKKHEEKPIEKNGRDVFVVLTYPDTSIKEEITKKCINSLKNAEKKIILSSHYPISKELQESVDYYLYDSYNPLLEHTLYNYYWSNIPEGKIEINLSNLKNNSKLNQSLTVLNNIENSIRFAQKTGFEKVICVSYDFIFSEENVEKIDYLCYKIDKQKKKGYFMSYGEEDRKLLKSVFFIVDVDFYVKTFDNVRTPENFNKECKKIGSHNFLENYFYNKLMKYSGELIIEETDEERLFENPNINIFSGVEYLTVLPVKDKNDFVLWFNSSNTLDNRRLEISINRNGIHEYCTHFVKNRSYFFKRFNFTEGDEYDIKIQFIDSKTNGVIIEENYRIDDPSKLKTNGLFTDK
jgi:hypothetical protein